MSLVTSQLDNSLSTPLSSKEAGQVNDSVSQASEGKQVSRSHDQASRMQLIEYTPPVTFGRPSTLENVSILRLESFQVRIPLQQINTLGISSIPRGPDTELQMFVYNKTADVDVAAPNRHSDFP